MPKGGSRAGAGRKPKALAEKILEGNPGKRTIKVNKFKYENQKTSEKIYKTVLDFAEKSGCKDLIADFLLEDFAFLRNAYLDCENHIEMYGRIMNGKASPAVRMALDYHKEMMSVYNQIWNIISRNSETRYESRNDFLEMLTNRGF